MVQNHKEAIETQKEKLQDIIRSIKLLETINNSGQFNKDIEMEQENSFLAYSELNRNFKNLFFSVIRDFNPTPRD